MILLNENMQAWADLLILFPFTQAKYGVSFYC